MNMNQKGFANIILVVVIVVLVGAVGYFAFVKKSEPIAQQPTPTPTQTTAPTKTPVSPTPTQKNSFTNPTGKYSFEYPSAWNVAINKYNNKNSLFGLGADSGSGLGGVEIFGNYSSIDKFLGNVDAQYTNRTNVTIDGVPGIRDHYKGFPVSGEQVVLLKNGNIYNIHVNSEKEQDIKLFEQIVSTFKFTN